ncbi:hypothetical protein [Xenorhabdus nematophila]|uniref:hypothetical protein n=1 Tax=Xenorhabdus nematophila TaxID=628 RepID=UPI0032B857F0
MIKSSKEKLVLFLPKPKLSGIIKMKKTEIEALALERAENNQSITMKPSLMVL